MDKDKNGQGCSSVVGAIVIVLFCLFLFGTCSGGDNYSSSSGKSGYSSMSKDEQNRRAAENEASHYHYDSFGHIYDDRN